MTVLDPHLDAEALSAAVDGPVDDCTRAHLATCPACRRQLRVWTDALSSVTAEARGDRLRADDAERILAVALGAAALAAPPATGGGRHSPATGAGQPSPTANPGKEAPAATPDAAPAELPAGPELPGRAAPILGPARAARRWRGPLTAVAVGAAAAAVVAVAVVGLRAGSGGSATSSAASAGLPSAARASGGSGSSHSAASSKGAARSAVPGLPADLGLVTGRQALQDDLRSALGPRPEPSAASLRQTSSSGSSSSSPSGSPSRTSGRSSAVEACSTVAGHLARSATGGLRASATLAYEGRPAEVYVFAVGDAWRAWVLGRDCATLAAARF